MKVPSQATGLTAHARSVVALAVRDKALAARVAARLTAETAAVALVCPSSSPARVVQWLDEARASVLLLDERWLHRLGAAAEKSVRKRWPAQRVLLVGERACTALAEQVVRHRLQGFVLAKEAAGTCVKAVAAVERGETWLPRALLVELLLEHVDAAGDDRAQGDSRLTRRETEVVGYLQRGFANKEIADSLAIREDTVKKHLRSAYAKLGVHRRSELMIGVAQRLASN